MPRGNFHAREDFSNEQDDIAAPGNGSVQRDREIVIFKNALPGDLSSTESPYVFTRCTAGKRIFDIAGALLIGIAAIPIFIPISLVIAASGGSVLFVQWRVGRDRKRFRCYKLRSMVPGAEAKLRELLCSDPSSAREWELNRKLKDDPRVTRFGRFLRDSSIDELPQLWNVLKGEMSLVGPRPVVEDEVSRYGNRAAYYLSVRPGLTGLWQVSGGNDVTYSRRVSLDKLYVRRRSLSLDLWILWRTIFVILKKVGAY